MDLYLQYEIVYWVGWNYHSTNSIPQQVIIVFELSFTHPFRP